jgi:hypothetical protein
MNGSRGAREQAVPQDRAHQVRRSVRQGYYSVPKTADFARCHRIADTAVREPGLQEGGGAGYGACVPKETGEVHGASRPNLRRRRQGG